jgi:hypothetical protein
MMDRRIKGFETLSRASSGQEHVNRRSRFNDARSKGKASAVEATGLSERKVWSLKNMGRDGTGAAMFSHWQAQEIRCQREA